MITPSQASEAERVSLAIEEGEPIEPSPQPIKGPTNTEIFDALALLHVTYPGERVQIWVGFKTNSDEIEFDARVGDSTDESPNVFAWGDTPRQAACQLIAKAGNRSKSARIARRMAQLQDELTKLQAEAKEVA